MTVIVLLGACADAFGQNITASVTGTITDSKGSVVSGANVVAKNILTGIAFPGKTNGAGVYNIQFLPIGDYTLTASSKGFKEAAIDKFHLEGGQDARFDIVLQVGSTNEVVVVSALPPVIDTQDSTQSTTFSAKMISQLPLVSDNVMTMGLLTPGAIQPTPSGYDNIVHSGGFGNPSFNVNGNREQSNNFTLDGLDINDAIDNWMAYTPSRNSLQEYRMVTGNNTAEYGNANGGQVVMTTKSGTNEFHGESFFQFQNTLMNANTWAAKHNTPVVARQPLNRAFFGGTLGGPILKDRMFFFVDYRGVRQHQTTESFGYQPDPALGGIPAFDMTGQAGLKGTGTAYDPITLQDYPISNPAAQFLLGHPELFPVCNMRASPGGPCIYNTSGDNFEGLSTLGTNINQGDVKLDWKRNSDLISGRYAQVDNRTSTTRIPTPISTPINGSYPYHGFVVNWTRTLSSNVVNEARIGFSRTRYTNYPDDITGLIGNNGNKDLGIPGPPQTQPGIPTISLGGIVPVSATWGSSSGGRSTNGVVNAFTYGDKVEWLLGRHSLKFGGQAIRYQENRYYSGNTGPVGSWTFTGVTTNPDLSTGSGWADFLVDKASAFSIGNSNGTWGMRQWRPALYFQDDYKLKPDLTVNLGLRWEYDQPMYEVNNRQSNINPWTGAISFAGQNGASRSLVNSFWWGFMPRFGFAYAPERFNNRFVVRGGYAITNFMEGLGANQRMVQNPFFVYSASENATTTALAMTNGYPPVTAITPATINSNLIGWDPHIKPALVQQFDLILAYQINSSMGLQIGYVGQDGHHLADLIGLNQAFCSTISLTPGAIPCTSPLATVLPAMANHHVQYTESEGVMNYNAMQATLTQHATHDLDFIFNYTYSKAMTDSYGYYGSAGVTGSASAYPQDSNNLGGDYGPSYFDAKHIISFAATYTLPIGRGKLIGNNWNAFENALMGGWKASLSGNWHTGFPQTITTTSYYNVNNVTGGTQRANQYRPLKIRHRSFANWLGTDPSAAPMATYVTTPETCGGKTISVITGTTNRFGTAGATSSNNATPGGTTTGTCPTNPNRITINPDAQYSSVYTVPTTTNGATATSKPNTIFTANDNGVSAFGDELSTGFGTSSIGVVRDPNFHNFDASASKNFALTQKMTLGFRADAYNVFNTVSWAAFNNNISNTSFGAILSSGTLTTERHLQLGLNLTF
jgi:hypothetical protein